MTTAVADNPLADFDLDFQDAAPAEIDPESGAESQEPPANTSGTSTVGDVLYFDIETVPDFERLPTFDLPPIPETKATDDKIEDIIDPAVLVTTDLKAIGETLAKLNPPEEWIAAVEAAEGSTGKKPRDGLFKLLKSKRSEKSSNANAQADRDKLLSTTPLYCRIVSIAYAIGSAEPVARTAENNIEETLLLQLFWRLVSRCSQVVGFGVRGFDVPVILTRSILRNVPPTKLLDVRRYGSRDVLDLCDVLNDSSYSRGFGLKPTCKLFGIKVPDDFGDGSQVLGWFKEKNWNAIRTYNAGDVRLVQQLHREKLSGRFCL